MAASSPILAHFTLPFPPSVNSLYDGGKKVKQRFKSDAYGNWCREARQFVMAFKADEAAKNMGCNSVIFQPIAAMYRYGEINDKRIRDLENYIKAISDLLVDEMIIKDDSLIRKTYLEWADDVQEKYVEVVLVPVKRMVVSLV